MQGLVFKAVAPPQHTSCRDDIRKSGGTHACRGIYVWGSTRHLWLEGQPLVGTPGLKQSYRMIHRRCKELRQTDKEPQQDPFKRRVLYREPLFRLHVSFLECRSGGDTASKSETMQLGASGPAGEVAFHCLEGRNA